MLTEVKQSAKITPGMVLKKMNLLPRLSKKKTDMRVPKEFTKAKGMFNTIPRVF